MCSHSIAAWVSAMCIVEGDCGRRWCLFSMVFVGSGHHPLTCMGAGPPSHPYERGGSTRCTRGKESGGFSSSRDSARDSRTSPTDLGMRWSANNSLNDRRVREGTCRQGKTLVAHVMNDKTNDSPFLRP